MKKNKSNRFKWILSVLEGDIGQIFVKNYNQFGNQRKINFDERDNRSENWVYPNSCDALENYKNPFDNSIRFDKMIAFQGGGKNWLNMNYKASNHKRRIGK